MYSYYIVYWYSNGILANGIAATDVIMDFPIKTHKDIIVVAENIKKERKLKTVIIGSWQEIEPQSEQE